VPKTAYLSLGSNLGDRGANLRAAIAHLNDFGTVVGISSFYETQPVEVSGQPWFLNCVVALETDFSPQELIARTLRMETMMGRLRMSEKSPRKIDIDIILFEDFVVDEANLKIPHPGMARRRFVLEPLAEIAPDAIHPALGKSVSELLSELPEGQMVRRLESVTE
jgi:2-amino-4-hydroxy-6-hydroxymethyldihydropteridine diphosphokinase